MTAFIIGIIIFASGLYLMYKSWVIEHFLGYVLAMIISFSVAWVGVCIWFVALNNLIIHFLGI